MRLELGASSTQGTYVHMNEGICTGIVIYEYAWACIYKSPHPLGIRPNIPQWTTEAKDNTDLCITVCLIHKFQ